MEANNEEQLEFVCPETMGISDAETLRKSFIDLLDAGKPVVIQAQHVERVDTSILQLFCALCEDARTRSIEINWQTPSEYLVKSAQSLDLSQCLGLPVQ